MIKHNTKSSKELVASLTNEENVLAMIPQKELFNRSTLDKVSFRYDEGQRPDQGVNKEFFKDIDFTFQKITDKISL